MGITAILGSIGPVAKVLLKALELVDPKTRDWVRKRKALEWAEKYILTNEQLKHTTDKKVRKALERKMKYYRKWFFEYD